MTKRRFTSIFTFIQIAFQISFQITDGLWTLETSPPLPLSNSRIPIGYNPNTNLVWMVGGINGANKIVSFNTLTSSYADNYGTISPAIHAPYGKMYTQINNILYFVAGAPVQSYTLYKVDLANSVPSPQFVSNIPVDWVNYGCIAGIGDYIFVIQQEAFSIYNINTNTWTSGPSMINTRQQMMAEVTSGKYLYIIGGVDVPGAGTSMDTIEKIYVGDITNINNYNWISLGDVLSSPKHYATSVIYNQYIYVIGGTNWDGSTSTYYDTVDIIDTSSDNIVLSDSVYEPIRDVAPVIVGEGIYAFGGSTEAASQSYYQHYDMLVDEPTKIVTPLYGGSGGIEGSAWRFSPITQVISWGISSTHNAVCRLQWRTQDGTTEPTHPVGSDSGPTCSPFTLPANTHISSYRVHWNSFLFGLEFKDTANNVYSCGGAVSGSQDSGWITHNGYVLAGIQFRWGGVIDQIGFCFVHSNLIDSNIPADSGFCSFDINELTQTTDSPSDNPSASPTKAPTDIPTPAPTDIPTESPTYKVCDPQVLDWNALNTGGSTQLSTPIISSSWNAETLQFNIDITLDYVTRSKYTFVDQYDNVRGITYVIDTEAFLSDGRLISNPNNCENRESSSFAAKNWNTEYWSYLNQGNGLNSVSYLEYGPTNIWTLDWDVECEMVKYSNVFSFNELLGCTNKDDINTFTFVEDSDWLNFTGSFYVTLVSPLINQNNVAQTTDIGQYLTNTIANYPILISFPKKIASIRDPGVTLFDVSVFAIQYDEKNSKLLVDILSYSAEYLNLINVNVANPTIGYYQSGVVNSITIHEDDSYSGAECLFTTTFRCFQKFQMEIDLTSCPTNAIDLSTSILLNVEPECRDGEDCTLFRSEFGDVGTTKQLTDSLSYIESCDTEIYIQTFEGVIKYFTDSEFVNEVDETEEFSIGQTLYVDVSVDEIAAYGVFSIDVLNVWICTTSATDLTIVSQLTGQGGCIQDYASNNAQGSNIDEIYQPFKDGELYDANLKGQIYSSLNDKSVRFSLMIPAFQRNKFWLHCIVEMTLENNERRRARLLLTTSNNDANKVNRLSHYIKDVSIANNAITTTQNNIIDNTSKEEANSTVLCYCSYIMYIISIFIAFR